ncbi:MAG: tetratricopeptide repeat protein, partial [Cyanobacteria bacterium]|nr:tetratricopeptide repeat protein [Cyanobacteriota bacterium]
MSFEKSSLPSSQPMPLYQRFSLDGEAALKSQAFDKAEGFFKMALIEIEKLPEAENQNLLALNLTNIATALHSQQKFAEADPYLNRLLNGVKTHFGMDNPLFIHALNQMAYGLHQQGEYGPAEELYKLSLQIHEESLGEHHPFLMPALNALATFYQLLNRTEEAQQIQFKMGLLKQQAGQWEIYNSEASVAYHQKDYETAQALFQKAYEFLKGESLDPAMLVENASVEIPQDVRALALVSHNLSSAYRQLQRYPEALQYGEESLAY